MCIYSCISISISCNFILLVHYISEANIVLLHQVYLTALVSLQILIITKYNKQIQILQINWRL